MVHVFTDDNFEAEVLQSDVPVFVDFWAPWCGPCQMVGPFIEELAEEMDASGIKIGKINVDENKATAGQFAVMSIPTFMIFKNGEPVADMSGGVPKEKLKAFMEEQL